MPTPPAITDVAAARALFAPLASEPVEIAEAVYLDPNWRICGRRRFAGHLGSVGVSIRALVTTGLEVLAAHILLAHNHPSGDPEPSADDIRFTRLLVPVLSALEMPLADHLIVTTGAITSMRASALL